MKTLSLIFGFALLIQFSYAQTPIAPDPEFSIPEPQKDSATIALEKANTTVFVEQSASFPGGENSFIRFITSNADIPELVTLFGYKGRIVIGLTVETTGKLKDIKAFSGSGTGFEENILAVVATSPRWKPAIQNGRLAQQKFTMPFKFDLPRQQISMNELKKSSYKFNFRIKDNTYNIDQAEPILGKTFSADRIDYLKSFAEQPEENKKNKKYLIQIKD
jgi:protein TonB